MTIGEMIRKYRESMGLSQREFALRCGLSNVTISMYEKNGMNPKTGRPYNIEFETYLRLANAMGISVDQMFEALGDDASVNIVPANVKLVKSMDTHQVPVIGSVAAGEPILADETYGVVIDAPMKADYALVVEGDSMNPTYLSGDVIYIRKQPDIDHPGQVAVVLLDDSATVKHVYKQQEGLLLISDNPAYEPMLKLYRDYDIIRILGIVCGFTRMYM